MDARSHIGDAPDRARETGENHPGNVKLGKKHKSGPLDGSLLFLKKVTTYPKFGEEFRLVRREFFTGFWKGISKTKAVYLLGAFGFWI